MRHGKRLFFLLLLLSVCSACALGAPPRYTADDFPNSYRSYDVEIFWRTLQEAGGYRVSGFVKSVYNLDINGFELEARLLDSQGRIINKSYQSLLPRVLRQYDAAPFEIRVSPKPGSTPVKIGFFYRYEYRDDKDGGLEFYHFEENLK